MRSGEQYKTEYHRDSSFSIDFFNLNNSLVDLTSDSIPECYDYVLTQHPVEETYWQDLAILLMGFFMCCFAMCCGPYEELFCFAVFCRLWIVWMTIGIRRRFKKHEFAVETPAKEEP